MLAGHYYYNAMVAVEKQVFVFTDPYSAAKNAHAIVIMTEWDEFKVRVC
jgi:UDP-glucose 6-dehydrogenase